MKIPGVLIKRISSVLLIILLLIVLSACGAYTWSYRPVTDPDDLQGRRVAVYLSSESDYYLTGRKDMELVRYDTVSDMLMGLCYNKVDAMAIDGIMCTMIAAKSDGLEKSGEPYGYSGYVLYFAPDRKDLADEFDSFLSDYKKTPEYEDFLTRIKSFDGLHYDGPDTVLTGGGEVLRVAVCAEGFPRSFYDPGEDIPDGYDLEILKLFVNEKDYCPEFISSYYTDADIGLQNGTYDLAVGYLSDVYGYEVEQEGIFLSDPLYIDGMYFLQKYKNKVSVNTGFLG